MSRWRGLVERCIEDVKKYKKTQKDVLKYSIIVEISMIMWYNKRKKRSNFCKVNFRELRTYNFRKGQDEGQIYKLKDFHLYQKLKKKKESLSRLSISSKYWNFNKKFQIPAGNRKSFDFAATLPGSKETLNRNISSADPQMLRHVLPHP